MKPTIYVRSTLAAFFLSGVIACGGGERDLEADELGESVGELRDTKVIAASLATGHRQPADITRPIEVERARAVCMVTGCSSELCESQSEFSSCVWRPEYACRALQTCERQPGGGCGWTSTPEAESCIADVGGPVTQ
jgi:hypothetical protein